MSIPLNAIDPHRASREWHEKFTHHLDTVPPVMEVLVWGTIPSIQASRFDKILVTGGGFVDNITDPDATPEAAAAQDARELWSWIVAYTRAVSEWITPTRPAPVLEDAPNADPLTARGIALVTVGWLIDHADLIEPVTDLEPHRDTMFSLIRRLRGQYGVHAHPRHDRPRLCDVCGELKVFFRWVTGPDGSEVKQGKCRTCGETYRAGE